MRTTSPLHLRRVVVGLCSVVLLTGCTGKSEDSGQPQDLPERATSPAASPVAMDVEIANVSGRLGATARSALERQVGTSIAAYFDAAFLAGDYPRNDFDDAFASFSEGAANKAQRDRDLLTSGWLGRSTEAVVTRQKTVSLSALAPKGTAVGVTARVRLVYVAERGELGDSRVTTTGRLLLSPAKSGEWEIFGYDLARSVTPSEGAGR